jgi:hypothetical protein
MAFSNYQSISQVLEEYGIKYKDAVFVVPTSMTPSVLFLDELRFNIENIDVYSSEGARTELIISPILREIYKKYVETLAFWVQKPLNADLTLAGVPDYIFGTKSPLGIKVLGTPLVLIVEAKKNDFEQGWGQCLAELVAAQKINGTTEKPVYGIVTDGLLWRIGKLTEKVFTQDTGKYTTDDTAELFGAIDFVLASSL